jgi:hypothetical protein
MGKAHEKRFIIEVRQIDGWRRSLNIPGHFPTKDLAQTALDNGPKMVGTKYRVRSK